MNSPPPSPSLPPPLGKEELRARFRDYREGLSEAEAEARSVAICTRAAALPEVEHAGTVHVYWPLVARGEVDTRPLIRALHAAGRRVVLPVVAGAGDTPDLRHVVYHGEAALRANRWGILEPEGEEVSPSEIDVVVAPAFGAARDGHRIGHGHGFYDAFLAGVAAPAIGVVYAACLVEWLPAEPHDIPLDVVVTEAETVRTAENVEGLRSQPLRRPVVPSPAPGPNPPRR